MNVIPKGLWRHSSIKLPKISCSVPLGFPSPADDFIDSNLDLTELLIKHPSATYIAEAKGESMRDVGIFSGDLLIVDRAVQPIHNSIIVAAVNGELTCKILDLHHKLLVPANRAMTPIPITGDIELLSEGVVIHVIRRNITGHDCTY
jgi:DNA polymerase V